MGVLVRTVVMLLLWGWEGQGDLLPNFELVKTEVQNCYTGSMNCQRKLVVELEAYMGYGISEEDAIFVIDSAKDVRNDNGDIVFFQNPFGLTMHKSEALITYNLVNCFWHSLHYGETCRYEECLRIAPGCKGGLWLLNQVRCMRHYSDVIEGKCIEDWPYDSHHVCCHCQYKPQNDFSRRRCPLDCEKKYTTCALHEATFSESRYKSCEVELPYLGFEASVTIDIGGYPKCKKYYLDRKKSLLIPKGEFTRMGECNKIGITLRGWVASFLKNPQKNCFEPMRTCLTNDMASKLHEEEEYIKRFGKVRYSFIKYGEPLSTPPEEVQHEESQI